MSSYEIDLSTVMLIGKDNMSTKVITLDSEFIVNECSKDIINNSCNFFGSSLIERINMTKKLVNIKIKSPVIIEESRNLIFFPLKSTREKCNIWISYNNLIKYVKDDDKTKFVFKSGKEISLDFSYYIVDNQYIRSLMLDYSLKSKKDVLK